VKTRKDGAVGRQLSALFNIGAVRELTDGQLLERFSTGAGDVAELAFEALVQRHGAMVLRVCRAQLLDPHDTQDAVQATFLILVKKARALWIRDSLGPWLHQVAFRTASCARANAARRRRHERRVAELAAKFDAHDDKTNSEVERVLHEEINRLPECYRAAIVLCDLQAFTCEEAARRMGCPVGTVKSWRFRGRQRLRDRLIRLGLAPSVALGATLTVNGSDAAPAEEVVRAAVRALFDWMTAGEVSASVRMLVKGVCKTMIIGKLRMTAAAFFGAVFLTAGLGAVAWGVADDSKRVAGEDRSEGPSSGFVEARPDVPRDVKKQESWKLSLQQAIGIGLDNSNIIRVLSRTGSASKIAPLEGGIDLERFKSEVMAHIRSIEQQYWHLCQAHVQLSASEHAVRLAEGILKREQAELVVGRGAIADVAEAASRLEQLNLDFVTKTSDVITTDRQFRNILGLPLADNLRIVPVTVPTAERLEPNWEESLAAMLEKQPDVVRSKALLKEAEAGVSGDRVARVERQKALLQQVIHQTTHSLARFFLEIDANYRQCVTAARLRAAAALRLESQRAYFEEGRITIDRLLDAVSQYATAVAAEAQYKTAYNVSIFAFEEAKGTLLEHEQIAVAEGPRTGAPMIAWRDIGVRPTSNSPFYTKTRPAVAPDRFVEPPGAPTAQPSDASPDAGAGGKTVSFKFTVGIGSTPVEIRGSFTIAPVPPVNTPKAR
jgi:RNA polymerase sigma factor (sigma-70 family)